jgi:phage-related protein
MMSEWDREFKTDTELLEDISDTLDTLLDVMTQVGDNLIDGGIEGGGGGGGGEGSIGPHVKDISTAFQKFSKNLKRAPALFILEQLMSLLDPLMTLLEPIVVIFDILGGLLSVFAGEILVQLFAALQPVFDLLLSLTPIFSILGQIIGQVLRIALIPLQVIFEVIGAILKPFLPLLAKLSPIIELIGNVIAFVIRFAMIPLIGAIYAIGLGIAALINFFTFGLVDAISGWNGLMLPILSSLATPFEEGGIVTGPTLGIFEGKQNEAVVPLDRAGSMGFGGGESELILMDIRDTMQEQNQMIRRQSRGIQRRRLG